VMEWVKYLHVCCALLSGLGFFVRGLWMLNDSPRLQARWVKVSPHLIDSLLLISAITLAVQWSLSPLQQPWLAAKIGALLLYILLGSIALKYGPTRAMRASAWLAGLTCYVYIVSCALTKSSWGFIALWPGFHV